MLFSSFYISWTIGVPSTISRLRINDPWLSLDMRYSRSLVIDFKLRGKDASDTTRPDLIRVESSLFWTHDLEAKHVQKQISDVDLPRYSSLTYDKKLNCITPGVGQGYHQLCQEMLKDLEQVSKSFNDEIGDDMPNYLQLKQEIEGLDLYLNSLLEYSISKINLRQYYLYSLSNLGFLPESRFPLWVSLWNWVHKNLSRYLDVREDFTRYFLYWMIMILWCMTGFIGVPMLLKSFLNLWLLEKLEESYLRGGAKKVCSTLIQGLEGILTWATIWLNPFLVLNFLVS